MKTMDKILAILGIFLFIFTCVMLWMYMLTGGVPDTLVQCVFVACTGECGFMGWIKTSKVKAKEREEKKEDEAEMKAILAEQEIK